MILVCYRLRVAVFDIIEFRLRLARFDFQTLYFYFLVLLCHSLILEGSHGICHRSPDGLENNRCARAEIDDEDRGKYIEDTQRNPVSELLEKTAGKHQARRDSDERRKKKQGHFLSCKEKEKILYCKL